MYKGIVMEITDNSIVVMSRDGKFERLSPKNRTCQIGEEIVYARPDANWWSPSMARRSALAAAVVFCLVLIASFTGKLGSPETVAYISMDINPSIEMGIDAKENVVELRGLNADGDELIQSIDFNGKPLESVTGKLLDKAEQKSLAKGEAEIVIASTVVQDKANLDDAVIAEKLRRQVAKHIQEAHPNQVGAYRIAAFAAPREVREAAIQNGLSMGKYTVYLNAKNNGTAVTLDELKKESVLQIAKEKPDVLNLLQADKLPNKAAIQRLVEEEKSGELDKKFEERLKDAKTNKNGRDNQNGKNGQSGKTEPKNDPKKQGNPNERETDRRDLKDDKSDSKSDPRFDLKSDSKKETAPANGKSGTTGNKSGTGNSGTTRPADKQDDRKKEDAPSKEDGQNADTKQKDDSSKKDEVKKTEERRSEENARLSEEQKKKVESKKEQEQSKKDDSKGDAKESDTKR